MHQLLSGSGPRDAITAEARAFRDRFAAWGWGGDDLAARIVPGLNGRFRSPAQLCARRDDVLLIHHSAGLPGLEEILAAPGRKLLLHHNVTPARWLWDQAPVVAARCALGREQLSALVAACDFAAADSAFNAAELWGGDIVHPLTLGAFVGTGGAIVPALVVLAVAGAGLVGVRLPGRAAMPGLPRRSALALGTSIALLCLLDLRFRLDGHGAYMDFKHLSFLGVLVLTVAGAGLARWADRRSITAIVVAGALALGWAVTALPQGHREMLASQTQVDPELFAVRRWANELPRGASVRVDVLPSGLQLWAVSMLGSHPVDASAPLLYTTYAHAVYGLRADYSLSLRYVAGPDGRVRAAPRPLLAVGPPLRRNDQFALWRIRWPARLQRFPDPSSPALVEP